MKKNMVMLFVLIIFLGTIAACTFTTGERTIISNGKVRVYYLELPKNYDSSTAYPLIFAFHGLTGDYTSFTEGSYYNLQSVMGEEAILVYPNALPDAADVTKWVDSDIDFFDDLYAELDENLLIDTRKVFALGHSAGAGFTHELGCQKGDILRAIAPVAGSLTSEDSACIGQVAVMQTQGSTDTTTPPGTACPTREYWVAINSCEKDEPGVGVDTSCDAYVGCDTNFPVQYCYHSGGHEWPDFATEAIWDFFKSLPEVAQSDEKGTGDVENIGKGTANFKINYPSDFVGVPEKMALALYPSGTTPPVYVSPSYFLSVNVPLGVVNIGEVTEYTNVETAMSCVEYGDYAITVVVYVEGSNYPIPTTGVDYQGFQEITVNSDTITVDTQFELEFVDSF